MDRNPPTSFRLTAEAREHLTWLSKHLGISHTAVLELVIREKARAERRKAAQASDLLTNQQQSQPTQNRTRLG
jgi:hypothetical protein